jgi:DNA-binding transcriptional ArsR family regulator
VPSALRAALARVGDRTGETWLHLLGLALESTALDAASFVDEIADVDPLELRRHLLGAHVPAWRSLVGAETIERAARGEREAARRLLADDRYYGGRARDGLATLLPLTPNQTKRRLLAALRAFLPVLAPREAELVDVLEEDARRRRVAMAAASPEVVIAGATGGYVYEPEPEFARVVLVPHVGAAPSLLLCQHRETRVICYPAQPQAADAAERTVRLGKALSDPVRVEMLRVVAGGETTLTELARRVEIAKSTAHHHLAALRAAGLVTVRGNARGYWYGLSLDGVAASRRLLAELVAP